MLPKLNRFWRLCKPPVVFCFLGLSLLLSLSGCDLINPILPAVDPPSTTSTPFPTATSDPSGRFIAYLSTDLGIALRYPPNWIVDDDMNLRVASSADLLTGSGQASSDPGALLTIDAAPEAMIASDNLATPLRDFAIDQGGLKIVEEPNNILIGGQPAAVLSAISNDESGQELVHIMALVKNGRAGIIATGTTFDPGANEALLRGIIGTVIVSRPEPTPAPPTLTPPAQSAASESGSFGQQVDPESGEAIEPIDSGVSVPAGLLQFQSSDGRFSLGYPSDWRVRDDGSAVIFASTDELLADNKFETGASILIFSQAVSTPEEPDPVKLLEDFVAQFAVYDTVPELVVPPRSLTFGGQSAAHVQYDVVFQRYAILVDYYAIVKGQTVIIMVNLISANDFESLKPITDGMAASVTIN
ncbi:MAG: hypothetical protein AB8G95_04490 [Anaerolineae bacterium]